MRPRPRNFLFERAKSAATDAIGLGRDGARSRPANLTPDGDSSRADLKNERCADEVPIVDAQLPILSAN
jgi:hypothetical protein